MDARRLSLSRRRRAYTLIEIACVLGIIGILATLAGVRYRGYQDRAHKAAVIVAMKGLSTEIDAFLANGSRLPRDLAEIGMAGMRDPWGNPYQYTNLGTAPPGRARKDHFLVPINSDYDLWSMGPDGGSAPPLTARQSRDDIIRANNGSFYGTASNY